MKTKSVTLILGAFLSGCSEGYPKLGDGYRIVGEGGYTTVVVDTLNTVIVSEYILDYAADSNFILIAQSPPDSLPKKNFLYYSDADRKKLQQIRMCLNNTGLLIRK